MQICKYPNGKWDLLSLYNDERSRGPAPSSLEIPDGSHGCIVRLTARCTNSMVGSTTGFVDTKQLDRCTSETETLRMYRVSPVTRSVEADETVVLEVSVLLAAPRPFRTIETSSTLARQSGKRNAHRAYKSRPVAYLREKLEVRTLPLAA